MRKPSYKNQLRLFPPEGIPQRDIPGELRAKLTELLSHLILSVLEGAKQSRGEENRKEGGGNG